MNVAIPNLVAIVPAAGVGERMQADRPKQYLPLLQSTVLEQTLSRLAAHPAISDIVIAVAEQDPYFDAIQAPVGANLHRVDGGKERADSVLNGLHKAQQLSAAWVLVHDAARPCVSLADIDRLIEQVLTVSQPTGGILAHPVRDTMKLGGADNHIEQTLDRTAIWHAMTPQMFPTQPLLECLSQALQQQQTITDEASAMEWRGDKPLLVKGSSSNIKITHPEDLALAEFYLTRSKP